MDTVKSLGGESDTSLDVLASWFDADRRGRLILDSDLSLRWCNAAGRLLLSSAKALVLWNGSVRTRDAGEGARFLQFIKGAGRALSVHCISSGDDGHMVIAARRLTDSTLVGVTAYITQDPADYQWADLSQAFGLTGAERDIVQSLSCGYTAENIAARQSVSVKTIRTHIRHAYSKLEVSSREELFHKLAPYMVVD
jgi:DNA-binding CsgD family transcriptional regulator